jgi:hypothetical protein
MSAGPNLIVARKAAPPKTLNLIYVHQPDHLWHYDIEAIAKNMSAIAPEIKFLGVMKDQSADVISPAEWSRPTLTFSFGPVRHFIPPRGPVYENRFVSKLDQFRAFRRLGVPTPHTAAYRHGMDLNPADWGPFVILKPSDPANMSNGLYLQVFRTVALSGRQLPHDHPSRRLRMLVQQWIDTGEKLTAYRCLTLFGAVLYLTQTQRTEARPSLDSPDNIIEAMPAESDRGQTTRARDRSLMEFAPRMAEAFPRHSILGCDILREHSTGRLYALEVNGGGNVWHFSSPRTAPWRTFEKTLSLRTEFSSFEIAAEVLARKTRLEAR